MSGSATAVRVRRPRIDVRNQPDRQDDAGQWLHSWTVDMGDYIEDRYSRSGRIWHGMSARCEEGSAFRALSPWYEGCICAFTDYQHFAAWCQLQYGYGLKDENGMSWELDKDIIEPGNKVYRPERCCFVPKGLNSLLTMSGATRGRYPLGVSVIPSRKKIFRARVKKHNREYALGYFDSATQAHRAWQSAKIEIILETAISLPSEMMRVATGLRKHAALICADLTAGVETIR